MREAGRPAQPPVKIANIFEHYIYYITIYDVIIRYMLMKIACSVTSDSHKLLYWIFDTDMIYGLPYIFKNPEMSKNQKCAKKCVFKIYFWQVATWTCTNSSVSKKHKWKHFLAHCTIVTIYRHPHMFSVV